MHGEYDNVFLAPRLINGYTSADSEMQHVSYQCIVLWWMLDPAFMVFSLFPVSSPLHRILFI